MFDNLSDRLTATLRVIGGKARLTEENIGETLREVRRALLEADVALEVVKSLSIASAIAPSAWRSLLHCRLARLS